MAETPLFYSNITSCEQELFNKYIIKVKMNQDICRQMQADCVKDILGGGS